MTVLVGTPTFVRYILERSTPGSLEGLRLIVVGAEKCPAALVERCRVAAPRAPVVEGYGITECSPVVSVDPPSAAKLGSVGKPLPGVTVRVVDTGAGIAADLLPYIYERFETSERSTKRSRSGLGLGLGITRELVKLHGGTIHAASDGAGAGIAPIPDSGTVARIWQLSVDVLPTLKPACTNEPRPSCARTLASRPFQCSICVP